jgi:di/tricarboxylate transporter
VTKIAPYARVISIIAAILLLLFPPVYRVDGRTYSTGFGSLFESYETPNYINWPTLAWLGLILYLFSSMTPTGPAERRHRSRSHSSSSGD